MALPLGPVTRHLRALVEGIKVEAIDRAVGLPHQLDDLFHHPLGAGDVVEPDQIGAAQVVILIAAHEPCISAVRSAGQVDDAVAVDLGKGGGNPVNGEHGRGLWLNKRLL